MPTPLACEATELRLSYSSFLNTSAPNKPHTVLDIDHFSIKAGTCVGITGPSGAGKTSLIHVLSGIEKADNASVCWDTINICQLSESARDAWRRDHVGLIFQDFHLFPGLSVLQNVTIATTFGGRTEGLKERAHALLDHVGVSPDQHHSVDTLSRGERQRVAIARALLKSPPIIVADEPTASLDSASSKIVTDLLLDTRGDATLIVVSHDNTLLERLDTVHYLRNGRLTSLAGANT